MTVTINLKTFIFQISIQKISQNTRIRKNVLAPPTLGGGGERQYNIVSIIKASIATIIKIMHAEITTSAKTVIEESKTIS